MRLPEGSKRNGAKITARVGEAECYREKSDVKNISTGISKQPQLYLIVLSLNTAEGRMGKRCEINTD